MIYLAQGNEYRDGTFEQLIEEDGGGGRVCLIGGSGYARVVHDDGEKGVLESKCDQPENVSSIWDSD